MTNNFKMIADWSICKRHNEVEKLVDKIEKSIKQNELDYVYISGRKMIEIIFSDKYGDVSNLDDALNVYTRENLVSTKVKNALFVIKNMANEEVHVARNTDKPFLMKKDIFSCVEFLKQIYIVIKHFIIEYNGIDASEVSEEDYGFDSSLYGTSVSTEDAPSATTEDVSPSTDSLVSKTKGIFELICSEYSFLIPTYQRVYTWSEENVLIFLQDIKDRQADKKTHYMGSLAIAVDADNHLLRLIDGQQRITTSLLLIKAIIDRLSKSKVVNMPKELEELAKRLKDKYINKTGEFGEMNHVKKILSGIFLEDKQFKNSTAWKNFNTIQEFLTEMTDKSVEEFYTTFVYNFVIAELRFNNNLDNEIQIFENLNSKGMELSQWDLIKNYIYKKVDINLLLAYEHEIESTILNKMFVIPASIYFQEKKYKELSEFFAMYCRIAHKKAVGEVLEDKGKIHKIFATVWPKSEEKFTSIESLRESLMEIAKYFSIFSELKSGNYKELASPLFELKLPIENTSEKDAHYPLMMSAIFDNSLFDGSNLDKVENKAKLLDFLENIEKYIVRLLVVNNIGQSLPKFFDKFISNNFETSSKLFIATIAERNSTSTSLSPFSDFKKELKEKTDWQEAYAKAVLRRLEAISSSLTNKSYKILLNSSLEHIMPQKVDKESEWFTQYSPMSFERFKDKHVSHINKLGNYAFLSNALNAKAKNYSFTRKKQLYEEDAEAKLLSGSIGEKQIMNLLIKDSFTFEDIDKRTNELAELIAPLYKFSFE